jgi:hypothetical protein
MVRFRRWFSSNLRSIVAICFAGGLCCGLFSGLVVAAIMLTAPPAAGVGVSAAIGLLAFCLVAGLIIGAGMGLEVWLLHRLMVRAWKRYARRRVRFEARVDLPLPPEQAFARCLWAVRSVRYCTIRRADPGLGTIKATVGLNFWSHDEVIRARARRADDTRTRMDLFSRCVFPSQRIDWGKNRANVLRIIGFLEEAAAQQQSPVT